VARVNLMEHSERWPEDDIGWSSKNRGAIRPWKSEGLASFAPPSMFTKFTTFTRLEGSPAIAY
jgi:hypothetical protein